MKHSSLLLNLGIKIKPLIKATLMALTLLVCSCTGKVVSQGAFLESNQNSTELNEDPVLMPSSQSSFTPTASSVAKIYVKKITTSDPSSPGGVRLLNTDEDSPYFEMVGNSISTFVISGGYSLSPPIFSKNGRYVLFPSHEKLTDSQLASGNVYFYRKDLDTDNIELINKDMNGNPTQVALYNSMGATSEDGRFVVFRSETPMAQSVIENGFSGSNLYLKDMTTGISTHISDNTESMIKNFYEINPNTISSDGRYVIYNNDGLIYRKDTTSVSSASIISKSEDGLSNLNTMMYASGMISLSGDGTRFVFITSDTSLADSSGNGSHGLVIRDLNSNSNQIITEFSNIFNPIITQDGEKVFFNGTGSGIHESVVSGMPQQVFSWSQSEGIQLVSVNYSGGLYNSMANLDSVSSNGRFVCFWTNATNSATGNFVRQGGWMVIVKDLLTGKAVVVDADANGSYSNGYYRSNCSLSADGQYIIFSSY